MMQKKFSLIVILFLLSGCSQYQVDVQITPERRAELKNLIEESQLAIDNFKGEEGEIPLLHIINQADAYHEMGEIGKAINVYEKLIKEGKQTIAILNNVGRLYEEVGEYEKAIEAYMILNDQYIEKNYLYDITWAYIKMGDLKNAQKYFNAWQLEFKKTDTQTQQAIKELKVKLDQNAQ